MKQQDILTTALSGKPVAVGKFVDWEVKEPKLGTVIATTTILLGRETVGVQQFQPKGVKPENVARPPFKPDQKVVFAGRIEYTKYGLRGRGEISALES